MTTIAGATADLEVGLLMYCAGADPRYEPFLAQPVDTALAMLHRNCVVPTQLCHHFGAAMVARHRGGIILVSSAAAFAGGPNLAVYAGTKAFDMVFAESLWADLHGEGVDVLSLVLGETDTPALRRLREQRGLPVDPDAPLPGAATVDEVVADALERLPQGPSWIVGEFLATHRSCSAACPATRQSVSWCRRAPPRWATRNEGKRDRAAAYSCAMTSSPNSASVSGGAKSQNQV